MSDLPSKLSSKRPFPPSQPESWQRALESDRGRIINSAAVRRLQQKTQVFPLERNAAVRSRLTHSLEVQQTGRFIVQTLFAKLREQDAGHELAPYEREVESMVEMACLMHDIGNPPFGHFGEAAISGWFADFLPQLPALESTALRRELANFEGNAQGIRIISSLQRLNLTYAQAACVLKYTRMGTEARPAAAHPRAYLQKKPGFYVAELDYVRAMREHLHMAEGARHPLTYLMEAADDISYCLADMEDGVDKGILSYTQLAEHLQAQFVADCAEAGVDVHGQHFSGYSFSEVMQRAQDAAAAEPINKAHEFFVRLRVGFIHQLVDHAAQAFVDNYAEVVAGSLDRALLEDKSACHLLIKTLKQVAVEYIFSVPEVETLELQGYQIIRGLLDHYQPLLQLSGEDFDRLTRGEGRKLLVHSRLFKRLPGKHVKAYLLQRTQPPQDFVVDAASWELYCRCRLVQDMVSGMTDQYALDEFNLLSARG
ncbi:dGTPase [Aliidiomarina sp. Khilg15.8]